DVAEPGADALCALETNWRGSLAENGSVDGTLRLWQQLDEKLPAEKRNWRFHLHPMRADFRAYTPHRLVYENGMEEDGLEASGAGGPVRSGPRLEGGPRHTEPGRNAAHP